MYVSVALPDTGAASSVVVERTAQRIERGKYLANHVTVCVDCHSSRDWSSFSGSVVQGTEGKVGEEFNEKQGFPGEIYAPNITPHSLSSWTDGDIIKAVTTGVSKDGRALFPLMGYKRFGKMDEEDIYSIVAYIRSLSPVKSSVPATQLIFPVNIINRTNPEKAQFQSIPDERDSVKYGAYLVNAAGCVDCHSKSEKGEIIAGSEFGGGMEFQQPGGVITTPNITFHKTGLNNWTKDFFVRRFQQYADSSYQLTKVGKDDLNSPMPWTMYAGMKASDLAAIYSYLKSVKPVANVVQVRSPKKSSL
jgi:mono/diheme cytochrome c family protein